MTRTAAPAPVRTPGGGSSPTARVLRSAQPPARRFLPGALSGFASAASAVALLAVSAWLIVRAAEQPALMYLSIAVVGVRLFALTRAVFRYVERLAGHDAALRQLATTRADMVRRLVPLAPDGLTRTRRGSVLASMVDDVDELQNLPLRVVQPLFVSGLVAAASIVFMCFVSWAAALVLAGCLALATLAAVAWGWALGARAERGIAPARARLADAVVDYLGSLDVLLAFGAEPEARARIADADAALSTVMRRRVIAQGATSAVVSVLAGAASIGAIAVTAPLVTAGELAAPWFAVAVLLPMAIFEVFGTVPLAAASWRQVRASAERIADALPERLPAGLVREAETPDAADDRTPAPPLGSGITLRGVSARWPGSASDALRDVDLDIHAGERLLVVGSSGSGKSTLAHVLVRFLDCTGTYAIGGRSVTAHPSQAADGPGIAGAQVRRTVGLCQQHPMLFDEDIRQNLLFARDDATDDELAAVLQRVGLGEWLEARGGLDARVGERGALVSGGQAQRIALARALLADFAVLVLDEPTAGVDAEASDALLHDMLAAIDDDRAIVLISHASVPEGLVDRTIRIHEGRIA
ncbi:MAG: thiol reductant ABC exporter subunit CydC [Microbacteriaceae bacterium]|jgi:ATP-binding cassette subfamily C protein CydC|nr:thiol reductant ABC exporter subunit CydC [Microbacteriaceae bacterium]HPZ34399.1 thiol reductant ABC exporter subunit CydC [Microbacteriaceae bacterium]HQC93127.1 thiol reductant ABC exporter subunit CydC [Microbacteriaceae bacterium]